MGRNGLRGLRVVLVGLDTQCVIQSTQSEGGESAMELEVSMSDHTQVSWPPNYHVFCVRTPTHTQPNAGRRKPKMPGECANSYPCTPTHLCLAFSHIVSRLPSLPHAICARGRQARCAVRWIEPCARSIRLTVSVEFDRNLRHHAVRCCHNLITTAVDFPQRTLHRGGVLENSSR